MPFPWAAVIPAAISAVGSFIGGERANSAQIQAAREQMAFQERMSSTAHQREVKDLRAAGLNPILSTRLGGASSPGGAMPNIRDSLGDAARSGASTALTAKLNDAQIDQIKADVLKKNAETMESIQKTGTLKSQQNLFDETAYKTANEGKATFLGLPYVAPRAEGQIREINQRTQNLAVDNLAKRYGLSTAQAAAALADIDRSFYESKIGRGLRLTEMAVSAANPLVNSADAVSRMAKRHED